jgi:hypothetical protein
VPPRTQTRPLDDPRMWRLLIARTHPVPLAGRGRDPMAQHYGDKVTFFMGDWCQAWPEDFTVHRADGAA